MTPAAVAYRAKSALPGWLRVALRKAERAIRHRSVAPERSLLHGVPWSSPNVWDRVVSCYQDRDDAVVVEYGIGVSTVWHVKILLSRGGKYIGVEDNFRWTATTVEALVELALEQEIPLTMEVSHPENAPGRDVHIDLHGPSGVVSVDLLVRGVTGDWTSYVTAPGEPADVLVVDGKVRKACVNHVLDRGLVKPSGTLALFEAGRGTPDWLGAPTLAGDEDYRPEVSRMIALGGELVDGVGLDRWPTLERARSSVSVRWFYPKEACFLVVPPKVTTAECE